MIYFEYEGIDYIALPYIKKSFKLHNIPQIAPQSIVTIYKTMPIFNKIQEIYQLRHTVYRVSIISVIDICNIFKNRYRDKYLKLLSELNHPYFRDELEKERNEITQMKNQNKYLHCKIEELIKENIELKSELMDINERMHSAKCILTSR